LFAGNGKGPDVGTLVPGTREKNWGWYLVLGMGNKVGTWYSGRKKMGLVPGIRGEIGFGTGRGPYSREKMGLVLGTLKSAEYQHPDPFLRVVI